MYDLHLHSRYSDGDFTVDELLAEAVARGVKGVSLTDHNGLWGIAEARAAAQTHDLTVVAGIEVTALYQQTDVHILGYSQSFDENVMETGLAQTRAGYAQRVAHMVELCQRAGYTKISWESIAASRRHQRHPSFISYDVATILRAQHGLPLAEARRLTVKGGACYVPYGPWAMHPTEVVQLIHAAGGIAVLAHPGTIVHESSQAVLDQLLQELRLSRLDGVEVHHPFHQADLITQLTTWCGEHHLLMTAGSDWHGPGRFHDKHFGKVGLGDEDFNLFKNRLA